MNIFTRNLHISESNNGIRATNPDVSYLCIRYTSADNMINRDIHHINTFDLTDGWVTNNNVQLNYVSAVLNGDTPTTIRHTGVYRITFSNGEEEIVSLSSGDIVPTKYHDNIIAVDITRLESPTVTDMLNRLREPLSHTNITDKEEQYPKSILEVKGYPQRSIKLRDTRLAIGCFNLYEDTLVTDDIPDEFVEAVRRNADINNSTM